jgi:nucleoside-diphosphate-sugar epimerase
MGKMTVLVTGANGFVGRNLLHRLCANPAFDVVATDIHEDWAPFSDSSAPPIAYVSGDVSNRGFVSAIMEKFRFQNFVHLAAVISQAPDMDTYFSIINSNVRATFLLCEAAHAQQARLLFPSTGLIYGNQAGPFKEEMFPDPRDFYSLSKLMSEQIIRFFTTSYHVQTVIFRIGILYGPSQANAMFIPSMVRSLLAGREFPMTEGEQKRDFVFVDDFVNAVEAVLLKKDVSGVFNMGSGAARRLIDVARLAESLVGHAGLVRPGAVPYRPNESMEYCLNAKKAENVLGWRAATGLAEGLKKTIAYHMARKE